MNKAAVDTKRPWGEEDDEDESPVSSYYAIEGSTCLQIII